jgi:universal stress protein A
MKQVIYKKILVTHDGSKLASIALPHALSLAYGLNTQILLFRVIDPVEQEVVMVDPMGVVSAITTGKTAVEVVEENEKMVFEQLKRIKEEMEGSGARKVDIKVTAGEADKEIIATAKQEHCDLIVMSTHGRSGLGRTLLGSVTDSVIRHSPCPVLVVRAQ